MGSGYPTLSDNALRVLEKRYLQKNSDGSLLETPDDLFRRVARCLAAVEEDLETGLSVEEWTENFYGLMRRLEFLPNSPTLMNAGCELGQLAACFVLPVDDSLEAIFEAVKQAALIHKSGGGTGFAFSRLRSSGSRVNTTMGISSGPVSFMEVFNAATDTIKQGGTRRGANMGVLRVDHPDILDFITCKTASGRLSNFNISVAVTDAFMKAVIEDTEYNLIRPQDKEPAGQLPAREVYWQLVENAWKNGDPGVIFLDRMNAGNPTPCEGDYESTNPCGEQPLLPYESCNLGSLNLTRFCASDGGDLLWDKLRRAVHMSVRFLDNVITANNYPLPEVREMTERNRKIGLGVMGFADLLIRMSVPYNSEQARDLARKIMEFIQSEARLASATLACERGPFPNFSRSRWASEGLPPLRNATTTTLAPTGTISIIAGCSSGIEPLYALAYWRRALDSEKLVEVNPVFRARLLEAGCYSETLMENLADGVPLGDLKSVPQDLSSVFVTSHEISPKDHVGMQAAFQKYTDNAVSKTINLPHSATASDVAEAYLLAYQLGCKGITVYRDGSRARQVLNRGDSREPGRQADWVSMPVYTTCSLSRKWSSSE